MRSLGEFISKRLLSFALFMIALLFINTIIFIIIFQHIVVSDYGENSPKTMLATISSAATKDGLSEEFTKKLHATHIWALYLDSTGQCLWSVDLPDNISKSYTIQDVASFSRGYLSDYPVFFNNTQDGTLVLGYPKDSYTKLINNYYSIKALKAVPVFLLTAFVVNILLLFLSFMYSKRKIIQKTKPLMEAIETLSDGKPVTLNMTGDLEPIAESVNKTSRILSRQNEARANWISGVSHDIRTPLSMILGYADRMSQSQVASDELKEQANIVRQQSLKIKDLVQDLNLVSQLEYDMQPLNMESVRLSKILRSYMAELLNTEAYHLYNFDIDISDNAEAAILKCDTRLITRAINNLVQNSIKQNPQGCEISLLLDCEDQNFSLTVKDNGCGISEEKLQELTNKPHYMNSTDERLDLRHGLGLLIVRQVIAAHGGTLTMDGAYQQGFQTKIILPALNPKQISS